MKRTTCFLLSLALVLGLTACKSLEELDFNKIMDEIFASDDRPARLIVQGAPSDSEDGDTDSAPKAEEPAIPSHTDLPQPAEPDQTAPDSPPDSTPDSAPAADPEPAESGGGTVTASHTDATFFGPGEFFHFQPKGLSGVYACTYESGDPDVASVDQDTGKVTAVGPGTTTVSMHVEGNGGQYDFECIVRCSWKEEDKPGDSTDRPAQSDAEPAPPPSGAAGSDTGGITASHTDVTFFNEGEHFRLTPQGVTGVYEVDYSSADPGVAMVDEISGVVTAVGPGTTTVTMHVECEGGQYDLECVVRCSIS